MAISTLAHARRQTQRLPRPRRSPWRPERRRFYMPGDHDTTLSGLIVDLDNQRVVVTATSTSPFPVAFELQRSRDQITWEAVRGDDPNDWTRFPVVGQMRVLYDVEPFRGVDLFYRVRAHLADGQTEEWSVTLGPVVITGDPRWWVHPVSKPGLSVAVPVRSQPSELEAIDRGVHWAIGRADPIVTYGARRAPAGQLVVYADTVDDAVEARVALGAPETIVIISPDGIGWGRRYVSVGDITGARIVDRPTTAYDIAAGWQEVASTTEPVSQFGGTWNDVVANYATWDDVVAAFANWDALVAWVP